MKAFLSLQKSVYIVNRWRIKRLKLVVIQDSRSVSRSISRLNRSSDI